MYKVCVIGGSGFIGTALCRKISSSQVNLFQIVDKNQSLAFSEKVKIADVRNVSDLEECIEQAAQIINLAAEHRDNFYSLSLYQDVNVTWAVNVCNAARKKSKNDSFY